MLHRWGKERPEQVFLAERLGLPWRKVTYAQALNTASAIGQSLLDRGLGQEAPVAILSGNSVDHALLVLGAQLAGVPVAPISPAYSLKIKDPSKLRRILNMVRPRLLFAENGALYGGVLSDLHLEGVEVSSSRNPADGLETTPFAELCSASPSAALRAAEAEIGPDTVAKYLFTSGSTGKPKGVINTQRMLCANQQMLAQCWPFVTETPPVLVDWLPWNHTFGGNFNFYLVLKHGGTFFIDGGNPAPGLMETTVENLRTVSPTIYFNVPVGFSMLLPYLERDKALRERFFTRLQLIVYAGAALSQDLWQSLERLSRETVGHEVAMASAWGATETAPLATVVHFPIQRAGVIGVPAPGVEIKFVPSGSKLELRVRGPNVTPGYLGEPELTRAAFDDDGFYRIGDAGRLADENDPAKGIIFDGRVAEDFKLTSGTWVSVGNLRVDVLGATAPLLQDAVVCGRDRNEIGLLAWPNVAGCNRVTGLPDDAPVTESIASPRVVERLQKDLQQFNHDNPASSTRVARVMLMKDPPSIDADEITDKGYVNQRATLENRRVLVERLFADPPCDDVVLIEG
jgi:feruloyl-CoA synthase